MIQNYQHYFHYVFFIFLKKIFLSYDKNRKFLSFLFKKSIIDNETFLYFGLLNILTKKVSHSETMTIIFKEFKKIHSILDYNEKINVKTEIINSLSSPLLVKLLWDLCNFFCYFKLSHIILQHYLKILELGKHSKIIINNDISIYLQKLYTSILFEHKDNSLFESKIPFLKEKTILFKNNSKKLFKVSSNGRKLNKDFFQLINNKRVAIIASANSTKDIAEEINKYDVVVRFNLTNISTLIDYSLSGSKVDVVYYRGEYSTNIIHNLKSELKVKTKFSVFKRKKHMNAISTISNKRYYYDFKKIFFLGSPNGIQDALLDLISFNPKKIKIFNCDLLISRGTFKGYRPKNLKSVNYTYTFNTHPPALQFIIIKKIFKINKNISGDHILQKIISGGLQKYLSTMEEVWSSDVAR